VIHQPQTAVPRIISGLRIAEDKNEHHMTEAIAGFIKHAISEEPSPAYHVARIVRPSALLGGMHILIRT
jgi:hypothetical protein